MRPATLRNACKDPQFNFVPWVYIDKQNDDKGSILNQSLSPGSNANRRAQHRGSHQKEKYSESDKLSDSAVRVSAGDFKPLVPFVAVTS